jgi:hypothetical protein
MYLHSLAAVNDLFLAVVLQEEFGQAEWGVETGRDLTEDGDESFPNN